ncbi:beta-ketoacyl-[acyl-carrier-protein] synthase family protein [Methylococcus capsulatus]|uniref:beta-ketoacyl-[acyl-carrier-protein] synthase family protein n=1 Tax=Methylococcus capsulatus TaxID=414 RepID=UPI002FDA7657
MVPILISAFTVTSSLGCGQESTFHALTNGECGLIPCRFETVALNTFVGEVAGVDRVVIPPGLSAFDCRNNRLALLGLTQDGFADAVRGAVGRFGTRRVGVFIGTSTSGMLETELAYRRRDPDSGALPADFDYGGTHNCFSAGAFVRAYFGIEGPAVVVSSACSSSAKVFGNAARMIQAGLIDAAVVGGVDSLCLTTLYGFNSLELLSPRPCRPFDARRDGISIGEAAAFALLQRTPDDAGPDALFLLGIGESSDAHHMSAPHPEGLGAKAAIGAALASAGLSPAQIGYVNLHGTGTRANDAAEALAVQAVFGNAVACSSTKGSTGHTLGAAGAVEAVISLLAIRHGFMPAGVNTGILERGFELDYVRSSRHARLEAVLSNSFGFGGSNCALVFGRP